MAKKIAVINLKGGVGKTTTAVGVYSGQYDQLYDLTKELMWRAGN